MNEYNENTTSYCIQELRLFLSSSFFITLKIIAGNTVASDVDTMKSFGKIPHAVLIIKLISSNAAFISSSRNPIWKCPLSMKMAKADSSNEIKEAFRISKEFGASSKEARVAWDIVEEIDASDNMRYVST